MSFTLFILLHIQKKLTDAMTKLNPFRSANKVRNYYIFFWENDYWKRFYVFFMKYGFMCSLCSMRSRLAQMTRIHLWAVRSHQATNRCFNIYLFLFHCAKFGIGVFYAFNQLFLFSAQLSHWEVEQPVQFNCYYSRRSLTLHNNHHQNGYIYG